MRFGLELDPLFFELILHTVQVYAGDIARAIEVISRSPSDAKIAALVDGKIVEAGGPTGTFPTASLYSDAPADPCSPLP